MIASLDDLSPAARDAAERYLAATTADLPQALRTEVRDDLTVYLCEKLSPDSTADEVAILTGDAESDDTPDTPTALHRLLAGLRLQDADGRIAATWWNPADQRLLLPRAIGLGWDLNLGAIAVRLGVIEPDAEAVPFSSTPERAFRLAAAVPAALAGAVALHYLLRGRRLPAELPTHWAFDGTPDRWAATRRVAARDLATTAGAAGLAAWAANSERPAPNRAGAIAGATLIAAVGAAVTVSRSWTDRPRPWLPVALIGPGMVAVAGVLAGLARAGRAAEIKRDLEAGR